MIRFRDYIELITAKPEQDEETGEVRMVGSKTIDECTPEEVANYRYMFDRLPRKLKKMFDQDRVRKKNSLSYKAWYMYIGTRIDLGKSYQSRHTNTHFYASRKHDKARRQLSDPEYHAKYIKSVYTPEKTKEMQGYINESVEDMLKNSLKLTKEEVEFLTPPQPVSANVNDILNLTTDELVDKFGADMSDEEREERVQQLEEIMNRDENEISDDVPKVKKTRRAGKKNKSKLKTSEKNEVDQIVNDLKDIIKKEDGE